MISHIDPAVELSFSSIGPGHLLTEQKIHHFTDPESTAAPNFFFLSFNKKCEEKYCCWKG